MISSIVLIVIIGLIVFYFIGIYNNLIALRNQYRNAFKQIDVQLKRRYDLIPNLVESAKGYLAHERGTLDEVIKARNNAFSASNTAAANPGNADAMNGLMKAEGILGGAMGKFMAVVEAYPDLKANQTISQLMEEITTTENKISFARQAYNDVVATYNTSREKFPNSIVANSFNFLAANFLEAVENPEERKAPKVSFQ